MGALVRIDFSFLKAASWGFPQITLSGYLFCVNSDTGVATLEKFGTYWR